MEIEELDGDGRVLRSHPLATTQRWVYRYELELLLRAAGFARVEVFGDFDRRPFASDTDQMVVRAWAGADR